MIVVNIRRGESIDRALKRFKHKCQRAGVIKEYKKSSYYLKPSDKRKLAKKVAKRRQKKAQRNSR
ncbi:30S ribosomal protein S21 [candidate division KSB1 bacterium]|nr:30S ribosomal protein S21 [candidate division KSB1 bacterium]NIR69463.1 30S ribosomal protein S21 [candidate division KSB1 bacterium]NIS22812.1 30S ribosomal protein S21 [candidate division KSB1 bacterium]NIT69652.1 30S ribosomal protein S21 [candidate division KSB1 bacterium]NIU23321.1 30S ribosomal protein S21 [candidate division KSB1 bacterium]